LYVAFVTEGFTLKDQIVILYYTPYHLLKLYLLQGVSRFEILV